MKGIQRRIVCPIRHQRCHHTLQQNHTICTTSTGTSRGTMTKATLFVSSTSSWSSIPWEQQQQQSLNFRRHLSLSSSSSSSSNDSTTTSSVSSQEVSKFSNMNASWWDPTKNPLIAMNPIRVQYMLNLLRSHGCLQEEMTPSDKREGGYTTTRSPLPLSNKKALDVGCGGGLLSESLARLGANVTAIDPSIPLVDMAQHHAELDWRLKKAKEEKALGASGGSGSIEYRGGMSVEELAQEYNHAQQDEQEKYDIICILEVLEHVTDVDGLLQAASSLLKPKTGMLFVSTMNQTWKSHAIAIVGAEYIMNYLPVGTHDWTKFLSPQHVQQRMNKVGLTSVDTCGMVLAKPWSAPPISNWEWKLDSKDLDVNWIGGYQHMNDDKNQL